MNKELWKYIGDPIVDSGIMALRLWIDKNPEEWTTDDLKTAADELVNIYLTPSWSKEIISIFPNSTYIQTARNYDKKGKSKAFLYDLINHVDEQDKKNSPCAICGKPSYVRDDDKSFSKTQIPLIGSSDFINYFPSFSNGIYICAVCVLSIQFSPLLFYKTAGKPNVISCNNLDVLKAYGLECINYIQTSKIQGQYDDKSYSGTYNKGINIPYNAIFDLAYKLIIENKSIITENEEITIYTIDNYNQNPTGVKIYHLPNNIFKFVLSVIKNYAKLWNNFLNRYRSVNKKEEEDGADWRHSRNTIHEYLLVNRPLLWSFKDDKTKTVLVPWEIIYKYMILVRSMDKKRIEMIKTVGDRIATCIEKTGNKKRINNLLSANDLSSFRNQLRLLMRDWQKLGETNPLVSFEESITILIPEDYSGWREVRDLIIIRLYEKLHDSLIEENNEDVGGEK
jgi:CRISPR-associated protein Cst1